MDGQQIFAAAVMIVGFAIAVCFAIREGGRRIQRALPGKWRHGGDRMVTTWNGHPSSARLEMISESDVAEWAVVEVGVCAPANLHVFRRAFDIGLRRLPRIEVNGCGELELRGDDPAFAQRLFADPVMAKTLPLALSKGGEELVISKDRVHIRRYVTDGVEGEALQSAWAFATAVVATLQLPPPQSDDFFMPVGPTLR